MIRPTSRSSRYPLGVALSLCLMVSSIPQKARAQAALVVPVGAAIVIIGGIAYYTWINSQGREELVPTSSYPMLEDPEDEAQWGVFDARDDRHCQRMAGGRDWWWDADRKECHIKG